MESKMIKLKAISILDDQMPQCIALSVLPEQNNYVASNAISLAEAYDVNKAREATGKGDVAVPYAVYANDTMVGFVMYGYFPTGGDDEDNYTGGTPCYYVWRLFIDKDYQGKGFGREVLRQVMEEIKSKPCGDAEYCYSSYEPENNASKTTFKSYGYEEDGRIIGGEAVARYKL